MQVDGRSSAPWDRVVPLFRSAPHAPQPFARELGTLLPHVPATLKWFTAFAFWTITLHAGLRQSTLYRRSRYRARSHRGIANLKCN